MINVKTILVVAGTLVLAGCGSRVATNSQPAGNEVGRGSDIIKGAIESGKAMKCTYGVNGARGGVEFVSYVEGKKYRTEMALAGKNQYRVFNEDAMYSWGDGQKQGMKMTMGCSEKLAKNNPDGEKTVDIPDPSREQAFDNAVEVNCVEANNVDFSFPTDLTFIDQCDLTERMLKGISDRANSSPNAAPQEAPINVPGMFTQQ
jgi:hypothetical protein